MANCIILVSCVLKIIFGIFVETGRNLLCGTLDAKHLSLTMAVLKVMLHTSWAGRPNIARNVMHWIRIRPQTALFHLQKCWKWLFYAWSTFLVSNCKQKALYAGALALQGSRPRALRNPSKSASRILQIHPNRVFCNFVSCSNGYTQGQSAFALTQRLLE